jgi:hypothetical protein
MKISKIIVALLTAIFLSMSLSAVAADLTSLKVSKHSASAKTMRSSILPRTDIHVVNNSSEPFYVEVPGAGIYDLVAPGEVADLYSDNYFSSLYIVLTDLTNFTFYRGYVSNHSTLEITDMVASRSEGEKQHKLQAVIK